MRAWVVGEICALAVCGCGSTAVVEVSPTTDGGAEARADADPSSSAEAGVMAADGGDDASDDACVPNLHACDGYQCGTAGAGCGVTIDCGTCESSLCSMPEDGGPGMCGCAPNCAGKCRGADDGCGGACGGDGLQGSTCPPTTFCNVTTGMCLACSNPANNPPSCCPSSCSN